MPTILTPHFTLEEFHCKDGTPYPPEWVEDRLLPLSKALETIRYVIQTPLYITSGYRTKEYNRKIGGSSSSYHLQGKAVDIQADNISPSLLHRIIENLIHDGAIPQGGLARYPSFVHYDIRGFKKRWTGTRTKQ